MDTERKYKVAYPALPFPNYGSLLQAYALYTYVRRLGYECNLVNYGGFIDYPEPTSKMMGLLELDESNDNPRQSREDVPHEHLKSIEINVMKYRFGNFLKKHVTFDPDLRKLETGGQADAHRVHDYDAFICGSDQVWKPVGGWFSPANYLQFAPKGKRIAYAPSLGSNRLRLKNQTNIPLWKHYMSEMTFLSGREVRSAEVFSMVSGREVTPVLDPTLLFTAEEWAAAFGTATMSNTFKGLINGKRGYIVAYLLHGLELYQGQIEEFARTHGLEIAWLTGTDNLASPLGQNRVETLPDGFLQLIKHASAVCTDSFHGLCFSLIFQRPVVSAIIAGMDRNSRLYDIRKYDILDRLGISERAVTAENFAKQLETPINYDIVQERLDMGRLLSGEYLQNALYSCTRYTPTEDDAPRDLALISAPRPARTINRVPLDDPLNCTGCGGCRNICPTNAISMKPDDKGFFQPVVNDDACIRCGKCLKLCPLRKRPVLLREKTPAAYAAWSLDPEIILNSTTGGIFSVLARWIFAKGGVVFGSVLENGEKVVTRRAVDMGGVAAMRGSKYFEGSTGESFREAKKDLENGQYVLFSGTSCQIAGLYAYLQKDYDRLLTADLVCAGVPSSMAFRKYKEMREREGGSRIVDIKFRSKERGWGQHIMRITYENGKSVAGRLDVDPFGFLFLKKFIVRTSCHRCQFKGIDNRLADITMGDFWGLGKDIPFEHPKSQGVSALALNSIKARLIFQQLRETPATLFVEERPVNEMLTGNPTLVHRSPKPLLYNHIFASLAEKDFDSAFTEWFGPDDVREISRLE